jgi:hypothetical protein
MKFKRLLEQQAEALRLENNTLRQAVVPEKQKYLPQSPEQTPKPLSLKEKLRRALPRPGKLLAAGVVLGGIAILVAVELVLLFPKNNKPDKIEESLPAEISIGATASGLNAYFGGSATEYGDRLYYTSPSDGRLYYRNVNGEIKQAERSASKNLIAAGNKIYYINESSSALRETTVPNGKAQAVGRVICTQITITQNGIYGIAAEQGELRKYSADGLKHDVIFTGGKVKTFDVVGNTVYILSENRLYVVNAEDDPTLLQDGVYLSGLIGEALVYSDGEELFIFADSNAISTGIAARDFNGNQNVLVCQDPHNPTFLYLYQGTESKILAADYSSGLTVTSNYVVYDSVDGFRYAVTLKDGQRTALPTK